MERSPPPQGSPWDLRIGDAPLAFVDLEMTGRDVASDRVVEVCIERVVGAELVARVCTLVCPPERVGGAASIHGLDAQVLAGAPTFDAIADEILQVLDGAVFVAHAAEWDIRFLKAEMARCHRAFEVLHFIDTLVLARRSFKSRAYSLDALSKTFSIPREVAHRADADVKALRVVFERCVDALQPASVRDLWEVRVAERAARQVIVAACEAAVEHEAQVNVTYRPSGRTPETLRMILTEVRSDLDPPRVIGYQLPGRGRRELRSSRILRVDPVH